MKTIKVELTEDEQHLFIEFRRRADVIAYLVGYMESIGVFDLANASITLDIDKDGIVQHTSITKHFRP